MFTNATVEGSLPWNSNLKDKFPFGVILLMKYPASVWITSSQSSSFTASVGLNGKESPLTNKKVSRMAITPTLYSAQFVGCMGNLIKN